MHYPFAEGIIPPSVDAGHYAPLKHIVLPAGTRFVAGFVHEKRTLAENRHILKSIENVWGQPVDVACSCGLGRRSPDTATDLMAQLVNATF